MLLVTHDEELAAKADRILRLTNGRLEEVSRREEPATPAAPVETVPAVDVKYPPLAQTLFSLEGRIGVVGWWLRGLLPILVLAGLAGAAYRFGGGEKPGLLVSLAAFTFGLFLLWPLSAILVKRCHDRNRPGGFLGWLLLPPFAAGALGVLLVMVGVPFGFWALALAPIPMLWVLVELLFVPGTAGPNRFGADPNRPLYGHRPG
jgi:uncharacterized membrane protein YhaH (DUF805 family)